MKRDWRVPLSSQCGVTSVSTSPQHGPDPSDSHLRHSIKPLKRRADAERNRQHLIAVAITLLSGDPFATIDQLAAAAGVGRSTVFRHFPTREVLIEAVRDQVMDRMHGYLASIDFTALGTVESLRAILQLAATLPNEFPFIGALIGTHPKADTSSHDKLNEALGMVQTVIEAGQANGTLRNDAPASWLAGCFIKLAESMVEGLSPSGPLTYLTEHQAAELTLTQFIRGARP
jgi:TetR/AcrR family transcriptional regulator, mexCD-oprJ operon repressor